MARKIILNLAVSLDGLIEGPKGEYDWCIMDDDMGFDAFLDGLDTVLFGRKSFELFGSQDPASFPSEDERIMFERIARLRKVVFSDSPGISDGQAEQVKRADYVERVKQLKEEDGKDIWLFGGASLVRSFIEEGLIDEYHLAVHPVVLGGGTPLFAQLRERLNLRLKSSRAFRSGVVGLYYESVK